MLQYENLYIKENPHLIFNNVSFSWPGNKDFVIKNCSFSINEPGLWMLVGKNGCGKSTLLKLIQRILKPVYGNIQSPQHISMVFQNPDHQILMPTCGSELILNVKENISKKELNQKIQIVLKKVGLKGFMQRPIQTLSGGQKQRLAIASCLIDNSNFILMDEPTALLDKFSQKQILGIIKSLTSNKQNPVTVLWITHRLEELNFADKVCVMKEGKLTKWENPHNFEYN